MVAGRPEAVAGRPEAVAGRPEAVAGRPGACTACSKFLLLPRNIWLMII